MSEKEKQLMSEVQYCIRCCMPATSEGTVFDELGMCRACRSSEQKMHINWAERNKQLKRILDEFKNDAGDNYDCLVPISGGKDSAFQLHTLVKVFDMKPFLIRKRPLKSSRR